MKKSILNLLLVLLTGSFLSACASIIAGTDQTQRFASDPNEASIRIYNTRSGQEITNGTTPQQITLKRGDGYFRNGRYRIVIEKEGFQTKEFNLEGTPNGWYIGGNLIFGGLIGYLILDPATGGMWTLQPKIDIKKPDRSIVKEKEGLKIILQPVTEELKNSLPLQPVNPS